MKSSRVLPLFGATGLALASCTTSATLSPADTARANAAIAAFTQFQEAIDTRSYALAVTNFTPDATAVDDDRWHAQGTQALTAFYQQVGPQLDFRSTPPVTALVDGADFRLRGQYHRIPHPGAPQTPLNHGQMNWGEVSYAEFEAVLTECPEGVWRIKRLETKVRSTRSTSLDGSLRRPDDGIRPVGQSGTRP